MRVKGKNYKSIWLDNKRSSIVVIDQRLLPHRFKLLYLKNIKDIKKAIDLKKPIVALESTLISHGLPYPENIKVANESIKAVEESGSVAATIGIIKGEIKIGLNDEDLEILATSKNVEKVSLHNIALSIYEKKNAATTVATSINIASKIGINFFAGKDVTSTCKSFIFSIFRGSF